MAAGDSLLAGFNAAQLASARREANRISAERLKVYQDADQRNQEIHDIAMRGRQAQQSMDWAQQNGFSLMRNDNGRVTVRNFDQLNFSDPETVDKAMHFVNLGIDSDYEVLRHLPNPDGTFTPIIKPKGGDPDSSNPLVGTRQGMPMTANRSSDADDTVVKLTPDEIKDMFSKALQHEGTLGGLDNASTYYATGIGIDEALDATIKEEIVNNRTESQIRPFAASAIADLEGEELYAVAAEQGVNVNLLRNQLLPSSIGDEFSEKATNYNQTLADYQASIEEFGDLGDLNPVGETAAESRKLRAAQKTQQELRRELEKAKDFPFRRSENPQAERRSARERLGSTEGLQTQKASLEAELAGLRASDTEGRAAIEQKIADVDRNINNAQVYQDAVQAGKPVDRSLFSLESAVELTDDDIRTAILQKQQPNEAQVSEISQYMQQQGISSPQDLSKLPPLEARKAAWLIGSAHQGPINEKLDITQKMLNYSQTGDMDKSSADMAQYGLNAANYRLQQNQYLDGLQKDVRDTVGKDFRSLTDYFTARIEGDTGSLPEDWDGLTIPEVRGAMGQFADFAQGIGANPAMQVAAKEKLPELFALAIVQRGREYGSDSPFEKWLRDNPEIGFQGVASRLRRNENGSRIALADDAAGRAVVYQGETDVNYLNRTLGPEIVRKIVEQLPVAEF